MSSVFLNFQEYILKTKRKAHYKITLSLKKIKFKANQV